jgi:uncharacterized RDD family membrane protein YckC
MLFDSVREELKNKITPRSKLIPKPANIEAPIMRLEFTEPSDEQTFAEESSIYDLRGNLNVSHKSNPNPETLPQKIEPIQFKPIEKEMVIEETQDESPKVENLRLVEFYTEPVEIPEWRLKVQNIARQRLNRQQNNMVDTEMSVQTTAFATNGATALKVEEIPETEEFDETQGEEISNPTLLKALKRIEKSRKRFYEEPPTPRKPHLDKPHNLYIAAKANKILPKPEGIKARINEPVRPKSATTPLKRETIKTNPLPPVPKPAKISTSFDKRPIIPENIEPEIQETTLLENSFVEKTEKPAPPVIEQQEQPVIQQKEISIEEIVEREDLIYEDSDIEYARLITPDGKVLSEEIEVKEETEYQEIEDCAPFALRFNAGLFDLLIGSFLSLFLLAPFMLLGGDWFTISGLLAFVATCSIVMFIYMTTAIGLFGKTFGMRLFSLEVVDIEGEAYPTLHQAAVSSSLYLLSLGLGGLGFLTLFTNPEKRAVHDLVSGTIVVKEF